MRVLSSINMEFILSMVLYYLLSGWVISFGLEWMMRKSQMEVTAFERFTMIFLWPVMFGICVVFFLKGLLEKD